MPLTDPLIDLPDPKPLTDLPKDPTRRTPPTVPPSDLLSSLGLFTARLWAAAAVKAPS